MLKTRLIRVATSALLLAGFATSISGGTVANAAQPGNSNNVTICHRTASVTNPYVRITVDQRSVGNANSKHGGGSHDHWATSVYTTKPNPNVFNPAKTYPSNDKKWGDIIAFTDVSGNQLTGNAYQVRGLNNTGFGAEIFNGTGAGAGLCRQMNARDYYEVQKAAGVPPADILAEMNELDSPDFASQLTACGGTFTGCDPAKLGTTSISIPTTTVAPGTPTTVASGTPTTVASTPTPTLPAGVTLAAGKGALTVKIWIDANRDGKQSTSEINMKDITVTIVGPNGVTKTAKTSATGEVAFVDLDPGSWSVVSTLTAEGFEKVYDSDGTIDWKSAQTVVSGQVASAVFAAASTAPTATIPAGVTLAPGKGALTVKIWIDKNRNGKQASSEKNLKGITVKIAGPNGVTKTAKTSAKGEVSFLDLDPGSWSVVSTLSIDGYEKVYDSDGTVNWKSTETVVEGQVASAAFAAATKASASTAGSSLPATGNASSGLALWAAAMVLSGLALVGLRQRRRA